MPKSLPVKHGDGREVGDLSAYMRTLVLDCQQGLQALLKQTEDPKLKLQTIKLILDYGWGRARQMPAPVEQPVETYHLTAIMQAQFNTFLERLTDDRDDNGGCDDKRPHDRLAGESRMVSDSAEKSKDA